MPFEFRGQLNQLGLAQRCQTRLREKTIDRGKATDDCRRRRPKPAGVWDCVAAPNFQAGRADTGGLQPMLDGANHQMSGVEHQLPGALSLDLDDQPGIGCLDDDFVVETQCQPETVEARPRLALEAATTELASSPEASTRPTPTSRRRRRGRREPAKRLACRAARFGILEAVAGHRAHHGRPPRHPAVLDGLEQAPGDAGRRGRLDEDTLGTRHQVICGGESRSSVAVAALLSPTAAPNAHACCGQQPPTPAQQKFISDVHSEGLLGVDATSYAAPDGQVQIGNWPGLNVRDSNILYAGVAICNGLEVPSLNTFNYQKRIYWMLGEPIDPVGGYHPRIDRATRDYARTDLTPC